MQLYRCNPGLGKQSSRQAAGGPTSARKGGKPAGRCAGFSLLEVILALAILGGALAVLGEVARMAMRNAARARDLAQAQLLCEAKLAEILAGIEPPEPAQGVPFGTGQVPDWLYSVEVAALDVDGLIEVRVTVEQDLPPEYRPVRWTLVRWMVDPVSVVEVDLVAEAEAAASGGTGTSTLGGTTSGRTQTGQSTGSGGGQPGTGGSSGGPTGGGAPGGATGPSTPTPGGGASPMVPPPQGPTTPVPQVGPPGGNLPTPGGAVDDSMRRGR